MTDAPQPLHEHLEELRRRLFIVLAAFSAASVLSYFRVDAFLFHIVKVTGPLIFLSPVEGFMAKVKLAMILGLFFSMPVTLWQAWRFVGVALKPSERFWLLSVLPVSYLLFAGGAALAWYVVLPKGLSFLISFGSDMLRPALSVAASLSFALWLCLGMGLLFQLPLVLVALVGWGIVDHATLASHRRHAAIAILVSAALITPGPDLFSQILLAAPTYLLFEMALLVASFLRPNIR